MIEYLCPNPGCLFASHVTPYCPYWVPEYRPFTSAERRTRDHLHKLKAEGRISAPVPGTSSGWSWALPWLLPILLPLALFLFFVVVLIAGR
ncbi:hypothetical protein GFY24_09130 [Nocardia sp. SYP-A9097]|uniref:hypothetical protein n=1 Tax=Nocardia sp. SYP-A9097 TaxID=2663237 RepID=UPI00129A175A|nr:hypothetical protein [Nocardia sp. SYP-A9097]MRH87614.1 hypothetical protein [Nocardia sp. SYP-A9097]